MTSRSSTTATIKWVNVPSRSERVFVVARVPSTVFVGTVFDMQKAKYTKFEQRTTTREQPCYVWKDSTKGQLIASLLLVAEETKRPVTIEYEDTPPYGWKLTGIDWAP